MPLSKNQLEDICLVQGGWKKCRFLAQDDNDFSKYYCLKQSSKRDEIDVETDDFVAQQVKKGKNPRQGNIPLGDNCPKGLPILKHIEQGYDK